MGIVGVKDDADAREGDMGLRGPPKTPTQILMLHNSWRAREREGREPTPEAARPEKPNWLSERAGEAWDAIVAIVERMRILTVADGVALARYCTLWARWYEAEQFLQEHGPTYPIRDDSGKVKYIAQHPQVGIANQLSSQLGRLEDRFGLTPSARASLSINNPQPELDDFERQDFRVQGA